MPLLRLLLPALAMVALPHAMAAAPATKPNVVLIMTDDQGYGDLGCTGNPVIKTPHIDALAGEAATFKDYHVAPTCSPTRAALLTGHWTNRTGAWHTVMGRSILREDEITLGQLLKNNGYATGMFGKWHLGDNFPYRPEDRGFDEVLRHGGGGVGQTPDHWDNAYFDGHYIHNGTTVQAKGFCTDVFFDASDAFIRTCVMQKKPFFAYIAPNAPHIPLHCPQRYMDLYPDQPPETAAFFGMITNIDDRVGKTRALLKELGADQNTIFIFTTDNGTASGQKVFNAGMRGSKGSAYDGGHRVPFILRWPAGGFGRHHAVSEITHAVDIVPTLLDLTASTTPDGLKFDGLSLKPLLDPAIDADWPERFVITDSQRVLNPIKWRNSSVMSNQWRLVNGTELYDIKADPGQAKDVAADHPAQVQHMRDFYEKWWAELEPSFPRFAEIPLGHPGVGKVTLTAHDWVGTVMGVPWAQSQIRTGMGMKTKDVATGRHQGHWAVKVASAGDYEIAVLRWPEEAAHPITATMPAGEHVPGASNAYRTKTGAALPIHEAVLRIDGREIARKPVTADDVSIRFTTTLNPGSHRLSPVFVTADGGEVGTYYAVVRKLPAP